LFATQGIDLRAPLRGGADDQEIVRLIRGVWNGRSDRYSDLRQELRLKTLESKKIEMYYIGG
jgi:cyclic pyranopterin phosphate synthase